MKKRIIWYIILIIILLAVALIFRRLTGNFFENGSSVVGGQSPEEKDCMNRCIDDEKTEDVCKIICGIETKQSTIAKLFRRDE